MNHRRLNQRVINLLKGLTDENIISVQQNKHIKVCGVFDGKKRVFTLSSSPTKSRYERSMRSDLRRFLESIGIDKNQLENNLHL